MVEEKNITPEKAEEKIEIKELSIEDLEKLKEQEFRKIDKIDEEIKRKNELVKGKTNPPEQLELGGIVQKVVEKGEEAKEEIKEAAETKEIKKTENKIEGLKNEVEKLKVEYTKTSNKEDKKKIDAKIEAKENEIRNLEKAGEKEIKKEGKEKPKVKKEEEKKVEEKGPEINLPEDQNIVKALQNKLVEYKERLVTQMKQEPYKAPELFADTNYKIAVLEKLLVEGKVNTYELSRQLKEKYGGVDVASFDNACAVIEDYAKTGGKEVRGGTGLKMEAEEAKIEKEADVSEKMFVFRSKIENSNLSKGEKDKFLKEVVCVDSEKLGKQ